MSPTRSIMASEVDCCPERSNFSLEGADCERDNSGSCDQAGVSSSSCRSRWDSHQLLGPCASIPLYHGPI
ncbi:hypothetical protein VTK73DRAFT_8228 [Phialemonium thermophilum]|uniref:Uncharacterized protein n=1 Tax=Phialemonium thermophilum TaxID=223376 RepID=A0ABR3W9M6_9PEZI